jgi:urea transport system substrate-binding protein
VVWKTKGPVAADPWSDFIAENKGKKNVPVMAKK